MAVTPQATGRTGILREFKITEYGDVQTPPVPELCPGCAGKRNVHCIHCGNTGIAPAVVKCPFCVGEGCRTCGYAGIVYERELRQLLKDF